MSSEDIIPEREMQYGDTQDGLISESTGNLMIAFVMLAFAVFIYYTPDLDKFLNEKDEFEEYEKKHRFILTPKGGVLQNNKKDEDGNIKLALSKKIKVSDDTFIFRFGFDKETDEFGLPIGGHVIFNADVNDELCCRKYTPISEIH